MMQFEFDPEKLIEEVKKRPGIWSYENVNYRSMVSRHQLWNEVVNELIQTDMPISKSEMRELVFQLQKKWKSIKDAFQKYIQNPKRTKRPYIYLRQLQFLLRNQPTDLGDTVGNYAASVDSSGDAGGDAAADASGGTSGSEEEGGKKKKKRHTWTSRRHKLVLIKHEGVDSNEDNDICPTIPEVQITYPNDDDDDDEPAKRAKTSDQLTDSFAFANVDLGGDDPDKMFLLSLLPHLKTVPEQSRLNVKMELLQVLQNANFNFNRASSGMI